MILATCGICGCDSIHYTQVHEICQKCDNRDCTAEMLASLAPPREDAARPDGETAAKGGIGQRAWYYCKQRPNEKITSRHLAEFAARESAAARKEADDLREFVRQVKYYASEHDVVCDCDMCQIYRLAESMEEK